MRILFAGTPEFAARCLTLLLASPHPVCGVLTQPDRPAGRGLSPAVSPVKKLAAARGIPIVQPAGLADAGVQEELRRFRADVIVTAAYGLVLPRPVLDIPRRGAINVHASLFPRWRGAAPIQRALLAGDPETGVSIMQMEAGLDTGPVLVQERIAIRETDTAGTLGERLAELGGKLLVHTLNALETGGLAAVPQPAEGVTWAAKIDKRESAVDWRQSAAIVDRHVRAFNPSPGARARVRGVELRIWRSAAAAGGGEPGEVLNADETGLRIACAQGVLLVSELQRAGGKRLQAAEFLRGFPLSAGERFETRAA
ncbi:MAG TPA: methionyl-tRNA formyltransferase [Burkholderiales bacterium]|nr:methionyl-tRNA formyltransferase [Burkholderiales bacterium]